MAEHQMIVDLAVSETEAFCDRCGQTTEEIAFNGPDCAQDQLAGTFQMLNYRLRQDKK